MSNILTGVIKIVAPGADATFNKLGNQTRSLKGNLASLGSGIKQIGFSPLAIGAGLLAGAIGGLLSPTKKLAVDFSYLAEKLKAAKKEQKDLEKSIDTAASSILKEAKNLSELRNILVSTTGANKELTDSIIQRGLAQFLFNEKNIALQKILSAEIEKELLLRKRGVGVEGLGEFNIDPQVERLKRQREALQRLGKTDVGLEKTIKRIEELNTEIGQSGGSINLINALSKSFSGLFNQFVGTPKEIKIKPKKVDIDLTSINKNLKIDIDLPPEVPKGTASSFATVFYSELKQRFSRPTESGLSVDIAIKDIEKKKQELEELQAIGTSIGGIFSQAFEGVFDSVTSGTDAIKGFFDGMVNGIKNVIAQLIQAAAVAGVLSLLGFGGFTGLFKGILGIAGKKADGGPVGGGQTYLVGERGPELFTPSTGGSIVPNHQLGRGSMVNGGMAVQVSGQFLQRGQDLLAVIALANQSSNRLG